MKLYNLYITRKIISYFLVIVSVLISLIWFSKAISLIRFVTEKGVPLADFFSLFVLILPWLLLIIIPVSLFIAVLVAFNQMLSHNEIVVLKNAGLNKFNLTKPVISLAVICSLICFMISFFAMPYANKKLRKLKIDFKSNYTNLLISPGIFENLNKLTIYVKERKSSNDILGVLIYDNSNRDYSTTITAKSGTISQDDNSALLYLKEGTAQRFNHETRKSDILHFDSYVVNLKEGQKQTTMKRWKASERYIGELLNPGEDISDLEVRRYAVELHQRMTYPLLSIVLALIACAFILSGKFTRSGNLIHNVKAVASAATFIGLIMFSYDTAEKNLALIPLIYAPLLFFVVMSLSKLKSK